MPVISAASGGASGAAASFDLTGLLTQGVTTMQGYIFGALGVVVPAIVTVTGAVVAVKFGIRWLKKLGQG